MNQLIILSAVVATALCAGGGGPTYPINGVAGSDCYQENQMFADEYNMCWFHRCVRDAYGHLKTSPQECAAGSKVGYYYTSGMSNPCTVNFNTNYGWECDRKQASYDIAPPCTSDGSVHCYNGGTLTYENGICWCLCPANWQGDNDCSKPTGYYHGAAPNSDICLNGEPDDDHCYNAGGCLNGGVCYNQCDGFWCDCPNRDIIDQTGKRCEQDHYQQGHYEKAGHYPGHY